MKLLLAVGFLCLSFQSIQAIDYDTTELDQLIENAHLIVHGEIIAVDSEFVDVKIHEIAKGTFAEQRIRITKFENWTCAWRWSEYKLEQTVLFFLNKNKLNGQWYPMGAGNEGEMPIEGGRVFYKAFGSKPFCKNEKRALKDGYIYGCDFDLQQAIEGIRTFVKGLDSFHEMADSNQLKTFEAENPFLALALFELDRRYESRRRRNE